VRLTPNAPRAAFIEHETAKARQAATGRVRRRDIDGCSQAIRATASPAFEQRRRRKPGFVKAKTDGEGVAGLPPAR